MGVELSIVILGAAVAVFLYAVCKYYFARFRMRKLVGPPPLPIIGNIHQFGEDNPAFLKCLLKWSDDFREAGYFVMYIGWTPNVMIFNPTDMETILCDGRLDTRSFSYEYFRSWLNDGLLVSTGEKWASRRKLLTPSFHFAMLKKYNTVFNDHARTITDRLCSWADGGEVEIAQPISLCILDVAFETIFGTNPQTQLGHQKDFVEAINSMGDILTKRTQYPWYQYEAIFKLTPLGRQWTKYVNIAHRKSEQVIAERKRDTAMDRDGDVLIDDMTQDVRKRRRLALLDLLIEAQRQHRGISDEGIKEEVDMFMFAGYDTTATATAIALYLLAKHTDVQRKVHEELDRVFDNDRERPVTTEDIQQFEYLSCVIKECMRLLTTIPYIGRSLDVPVNACGTTLPQGTTVYLGFLFLHRDPVQFPDPLRFDPDRFLPKNSNDRHTFAYLPFAAGNRNCIGQKFAVLELKTLLATIFRKLSITTSQTIDEMGLAAEMVLRPSNGIKVKLHLRE